MDALDARFAALGLEPGSFVYLEPMCGSLAVGLHIMERYKPREAHIADASPDIINFFMHLTHHYAPLVACIRGLVGDGLDEHAYYALRARYNGRRDPPLWAAACFYALNRASFNGVYRVNAKGDYNVPFGRFRTGACVVSPAMWAQLHRAHTILAGARVSFECVDIEHFLARKSRMRAVVYIDPPYLGTDRSLYAPSCLFDAAKHARMVALAEEMPHATVLVSGPDSPEVRALFQRWASHPVTALRSVGAHVEGRGRADELVFVKAYPNGLVHTV